MPDPHAYTRAGREEAPRRTITVSLDAELAERLDAAKEQCDFRPGPFLRDALAEGLADLERRQTS